MGIGFYIKLLVLVTTIISIFVNRHQKKAQLETKEKQDNFVSQNVDTTDKIPPIQTGIGSGFIADDEQSDALVGYSETTNRPPKESERDIFTGGDIYMTAFNEYMNKVDHDRKVRFEQEIHDYQEKKAHFDNSSLTRDDYLNSLHNDNEFDDCNDIYDTHHENYQRDPFNDTYNDFTSDRSDKGDYY